MDTKDFSSKYSVRRLDDGDADAMLALCEGNPLYYRYCPPAPTRSAMLEDLRALPPGVSAKDKYYIGFFGGSGLEAVMDVVFGYPDSATAFIGFFMTARDTQGRGAGSSIVAEVLDLFKRLGYSVSRLAFARGNPQAESFWHKCGFERTGEEVAKEGYTAVPMQKMLK